MENKVINDTIYSHIEYTLFEQNLLHTKIVSRLQFITQNALAYFAFPSINTKRYIHSIGTMHLSAHMYKNALLNAQTTTKESFLQQLDVSIAALAKKNDLDMQLQSNFSNDTTLLQFAISCKDYQNSYLLSLQALRVAALLHDVGHMPFSHQVEFAMDNLYDEQKSQKSLNASQKSFVRKYEAITNNCKYVFHEAAGYAFFKVLFEHELCAKTFTKADRNYMRLVFALVDAIFSDKKVNGFDWGVLHSFIDATIDADRLDYINRDMLSSGYIGGAVDLLRVAKQAVLVRTTHGFYNSFFDEAILDIEHTLEMRFNLYKKVIFNHELAKKDAMLEYLIICLSNRYFVRDKRQKVGSISMLWEFIGIKDKEKMLDLISLLDENWLISLFKENYFKLKNSKKTPDKKLIYVYEEVLFGKKYFYSMWKNLNDLYNTLGFDKKQRYEFRESFGYLTPNKLTILKKSLDNYVKIFEAKEDNVFLTYRIVSFKLGISKDFALYSNDALVSIDEISTLRKRLKKSMQNTVPFFIYCNLASLDAQMIDALKTLFIDVFEKNRIYCGDS
jgi:hypothetical protein